MVTFLTVLYVIVATVMVLAILLQSGKGGGLGAALGGGASQSVFGGSGGADFMSRLTQVCAGLFMVLAMYLAYASAHSGSEFLQGASEEDELAKRQVDSDEEVNYERVGPSPLPLPSPEDAAKKREAAAGQGETVIQSVGGEAAPAAIEPAPAEVPAAPEPAAAPTPTEAAPEAAPAEAAPTEAPEAAPAEAAPAEAAPTDAP